MSQRAEWLAQPAFFLKRFASGDLVFAELAVSTDRTHGVALDTSKNSLYCTCQFQPKPCIHMQAFQLFYKQASVSAFEAINQLPEWVRASTSNRSVLLPVAAGTAEQQQAAKVRRRFERLERTANGFDDLEMWLLDIMRRGLATAISEDPGFYKSIAGRLADASMRGLSRDFRMLESIKIDEADWAAQTLTVLADAALALHAFRTRDDLPEALLFDLEAYIGIALKKETARTAGERVQDIWAVVGALEEPVENQLSLRRSWLFGTQCKQFALLLEYAHGGVGFLPGLEPGSVLEGALIFYPSALPQRALVSDTLELVSKQIKKLPGYDTIASMAQAYAIALGKQPWLSYFPVVLHPVQPYWNKKKCFLADTAGKSLPISNPAVKCWSLFALSAGHPIRVFGEWNGASIRVLSAIVDERFVQF